MPAIIDAMHGRWFFFYGTLMHHHNNALTRAVMPLLEGGRRGVVYGQLRLIPTIMGSYPALCVGQGRVLGRVYQARRGFGARHLRLLDAYEEYDLRQPARSEYQRRLMRVRILGAGAITAQAYCYNRPAHRGLRVISSGDFATYAAAHGLKALGV